MADETMAPASLSGDAVRELWCWLWAGVAERECRIWKELTSSRDIRKEKRACQLVQHALVEELPSPSHYMRGEGLFSRLALGLAAEPTARLRGELGEALRRAEAEATGRELEGNDADAMALVLGHFLPRFDALAARGGTAAARKPGLDLSPASAYEFLAWLGCMLQTLELATTESRREAEQKDLATATAAIRMVLAQWVASLPEALALGFHCTWERLARGLEAARVRPLAGWLGAEAARHARDGDTRAGLLTRAFERLAMTAGVTPEVLRSLAPPCPMPWTPPDPLPPAHLSGSTSPFDLVSITMTENPTGTERFKVPLHQFLAALVRS